MKAFEKGNKKSDADSFGEGREHAEGYDQRDCPRIEAQQLPKSGRCLKSANDHAELLVADDIVLLVERTMSCHWGWRR